MAGQADGTILVDTALDPTGFQKDSGELKNAIRGLGKAVETLGPLLQKGLNGSVQALQDFGTKANDLQARISTIKQEMDELGGRNIKTDTYIELESEIEKTGRKLEQLLTKQEKMETLGVSQDSASWKSLQYDIQATSEAYDRLLAQKQEMESSGRAVIKGSDTAEYKALAEQLDQARYRLAEMQGRAAVYAQAMEQAASSADGAANAAERFAGATSNAEGAAESSASAYSSIRDSMSASAAHVSRAAGTVRGSLAAGLKAAASHVADMVRHLKSSKGAMGGLLSSVKKLVPALMAARGVMGILRKAVQSYLSANQSVANQLSSVWSNLGNLLGPIISRIASLVSSAMSLVMQFLALLFP